MMQRISIDDRLEYAASYGETEMSLFIWKTTIKRLKRDGLKVVEKYPTQRKGEFYCTISWAHASQVEEGKMRNQANHLYEIAKKAREEKEK